MGFQPQVCLLLKVVFLTDTIPCPRILAPHWGPAGGGWLELSRVLSLCPRGLMDTPRPPSSSLWRWSLEQWGLVPGGSQAEENQPLMGGGGWMPTLKEAEPRLSPQPPRSQTSSLSQPLPQDHCPKPAWRDRLHTHPQISSGKDCQPTSSKTNMC